MAKIVVVGLRGIPGVMGGVEVHCEQLYPRLKAMHPGDEYTILARKRYISNTSYVFRGIQVHGLWHARHKYLEAITSTLAGILYAAFRLRPDIIHFHSIGPALLAPAARLFGAKIVVTHHSKNYLHSKWNRLGKLFLRMGEFCAVASANAVIAVSPSLAEDVKARYPRHAHRIRYIPNGANHFDDSPPDPSQSTAILQRFALRRKGYTLTVGRLVPEKGIHDLIAAHRTANMDRKLVIVGGADHVDPYAESLKAQAADSVVFTGFLSQDEVRSLLWEAALFVLPSYHEGLPLAALEALRSRVPILLSDIQAHKDLELPAVNYFQMGAVSDLALKMTLDPERLRVEGDVLAPYDWNSVTTATSEVYSLVQARAACEPLSTSARLKRFLVTLAGPFGNIGRSATPVARPVAGGRLIIFPFLGLEMGGSHVSALTLAVELVKHERRCIFLCPAKSLIAREAERSGLEVIGTHDAPPSKLTGRHNPLYDLARFTHRIVLLRRWRELRPVVHCNDIGSLQSWGWPARLLNIPVVYHHRSLNRMLWPNRSLIQGASRVICISEECRRNISFLPSSRVQTISNPFAVDLGIDRSAASQELKERYGLSTAARLVGFVGNFWHRKRPYFFLDVCRILGEIEPRLYFVLFGREGEIGHADLKRKAEQLGILGRTILAGFQLPGERNIAGLDLMLAPAVREPFGRTLIEAILVGTPYVATSDAGHVEIGTSWGGGMLVDPTATAEEFAVAAHAILNGSADPVLSPECRRLVSQDVSPRAHAAAVMTLYAEVFEAPNGAECKATLA